MPEHSPTSHEEAEYRKLLAGALRSKILLLGIALILTWGLWATLRTGDEKLPSVQDQCNKSLNELKEKWGLPPDIKISFDSELVEVISALVDAKDSEGAKKTLSKSWEFYTELKAGAESCDVAYTAAYRVKIRVPYLVDAISVDGLALASLWPFGMVALLSASLLYQFKEHTNAVVLSWLAFAKSSDTDRQLLRIRASYRVGVLQETTAGHEGPLIYKKPGNLQPETFLIFSIFGLLIYSAVSLAATHRIEVSHEMHSVLFDYFGALWFFCVTTIFLIWRTWRFYRTGLEAVTQRPIRGLASEARSAKLSEFWNGGLTAPQTTIADVVLSVAAFGTLALPWIEMGATSEVRGTGLLMGRTGLEDRLTIEFQSQLVFAIAFVLFYLLLSLLHRKYLSQRLFVRLVSLGKIAGIILILLIGNLLFHFLVLDTVASAFPFYSLLTAQKNRPLIRTDPGYGFFLFSIFAVVLVARIFMFTRYRPNHRPSVTSENIK